MSGNFLRKISGKKVIRAKGAKANKPLGVFSKLMAFQLVNLLMVCGPDSSKINGSFCLGVDFLEDSTEGQIICKKYKIDPKDCISQYKTDDLIIFLNVKLITKLSKIKSVFSAQCCGFSPYILRF